MSDRGRRRSGGIVLVLVAGILTLLALLGSLFVSLSGGTRRMSRSLVEGTRASLLARSGVEYALARLGRSMRVPSIRTAANRRDDWTRRDDLRTPLAFAHNPSYAHGEPFLDGGARDGRYVPPPGSPDGFDPSIHDLDRDRVHTSWTGRLRGTQARYGDTFLLEIRDTSACIDVNLPDDPVVGGPGRLARLLNLLGQAIAAADGVPDPVAGRGADLLARRQTLPSSRFARLSDLIGPSPGGMTAGQVETLRPYVVVDGPTDPDVVATMRDGSGNLTGVQVLPRAPVNLNSAPVPVLEALLSVAGDAEKVVGFTAADHGTNSARYRKPMTRVAASIPPIMARALAAAVVARRSSDPFETWAEWRTWLRSLPLVGMTIAQADLIDAATNPNTLLNKYNPDPIALRRYDKLDVTVPTTEGALRDGGWLSVCAIGRVRGIGPGILAQARREASLRVARLLRHSTQQRFETPGSSLRLSATLPEPIAAGASPSAWDGQVVLARALDAVGADPLNVPLQADLAAMDEVPLPSVGWPAAEPYGPSVFDPVGTGRDFFRGGQVHPLAGYCDWYRQRDASTGYGSLFSSSPVYKFAGSPNGTWEGPASAEVWFKPVAGRAEAQLELCALIGCYLLSNCDNNPATPATAHAFMRVQVYLTQGKSYLQVSNSGYVGGPDPLPSDWSEGRRWHHLCVSWRESGPSTEFSLFVDGMRMPSSPLVVPTDLYRNIGGTYFNPDPSDHAWCIDGQIGGASVANIWPAQGSYGRVIASNVAFRPGYAPSGFSPNPIYEPSDVSLAPPPPDRPTLAGFSSAPIPLPLGSRLHDIAWTGYAPPGCRIVATVYPGTGSWIHDWAWDGSAWTWPTAADTSGAPVALDRLLNVQTDPASPGMSLVRYRVDLLGPPGIAPSASTPYLDDVTLRYTVPGDPRILSWLEE